MRYIALIGDIKDSRTIEKRKTFQSNLQKSLDKISQNKSIVSPYTITLGDEFQAVYKASPGLFKDILRIMASIRPVECRFAIGVGKISTKIKKDSSIGMDGPAFHLARAAIDTLKKEGASFRLASEKTRTVESIVNDALAIVSSDMQGWPNSRYRIAADLANGAAISDLAVTLKMSVQAVYKSIRAGNIHAVISLFEGIETLLREEIL